MLLALIAYLSLTEESFATSNNIVNVLETNATLLIVAIGLTFVMLARGFDLSLGGMLALSGVLVAEFAGAGLSIGVAIALALLVALAGGLGLNGLLIAGVRLPFLVVTLGTASLFRGAALVLTDGSTVSLFDQPFLVSLANDKLLGVPWSVVIAFAILVLAIVVLRYTGYGRMIYAVGGNEEAARIAGVPVTAVRFSVYGIAAVLAGFAGVLEAARLTSAAPTAATGIELTAAAAVLLGGTTFMGGRGSMFGTLLGVLFLGVLANGITLAEIDAYWQSIVAGVVVVVALLLDRVTRGAPR
jgi:ribose transport system permease protein